MTFRHGWEGYWFEAEAHDNLGICRILFFASLCLFYWREDFSAWGDVSLAFWFPVTLFKRLGLLPFSVPVLAAMAILAVSRCGAAWSLDRLIARARGKSKPDPSGEYRWPVRAVWLILSPVSFAAGVSKLRHGGRAWSCPTTCRSCSCSTPTRSRTKTQPRAGACGWPGFRSSASFWLSGRS